MSDILLQSREDGLLTLTLNRPEAKNALSHDLTAVLLDAVTAAAADQTVRAVLLQGAGDMFCAGGDVKAMAAGRDADIGFEARVAGLRDRMEAARLLHEMAKPTVAAIQGAAAGAGLSLALACDFRILSASARLTTAFAKVGLSGDFGGTYFMTRLIGSAKARELYLTSPLISAEDAYRLGLATRVVPDAELGAAAHEFALSLANGPSVTLGYMKKNLNLAEQATLSTVMDAEALHHTRCRDTGDHKEAAKAFVEKRKPAFKGH